jgi:hypothetical protein
MPATWDSATVTWDDVAWTWDGDAVGVVVPSELELTARGDATQVATARRTYVSIIAEPA